MALHSRINPCEHGIKSGSAKHKKNVLSAVLLLKPQIIPFFEVLNLTIEMGNEI